MKENKFGFGIIGVHQYPETTGIFTVLPAKVIGLKEGFYPFSLNVSMYTNFNPSITINQYEHITHREFEKLVNEPVTGMGISGLLTSNIWSFKETKSLF